MRRFTSILILLLMILSLLLTGCSSDEPAEQDTPVPPEEEIVEEKEPEEEDEKDLEPVEEEVPETEPENTDPEFMNPLTGLEISEDKVNVRPYAVMLNNIKDAMPQFGVAQADIIYELCAEGGITRMLGVYQDISSVGTIGSVRSARPYYIELALSHDAIFIHAGGSDQAYSDIANRGVASFDAVRGGYEGTMFWRDQYRINNNGYEHSMMTSGENIVHYVGTSVRLEHEEGYNAGFTFADKVELENGKAANSVKVVFSDYKSSSFDYSSDERLYYFSQYGSRHTDADNNEAVTVSNVIVIFAQQHVLDDVGRLAIDIVGSGTGKYFCGGKAVDITWTKAEGENFVYTLSDGTPLTLERGRSFICVTNPGNEVSYS